MKNLKMMMVTRLPCLGRTMNFRLSMFIFSVITIVMPLASLGHGDFHSDNDDSSAKKIKQNDTSALDINQTYLKLVKPIFEKSCFDCHSNNVRYPWYYKIPIISNMIDSDIKEAKSHLDFSFNFPFKGHGNSIKDLNSIMEVIENNTMPPNNYLFMHGNKKLLSTDKKIIYNWINNSLKILSFKEGTN